MGPVTPGSLHKVPPWSHWQRLTNGCGGLESSEKTHVLKKFLKPANINMKHKNLITTLEIMLFIEDFWTPQLGVCIICHIHLQRLLRERIAWFRCIIKQSWKKNTCSPSFSKVMLFRQCDKGLKKNQYTTMQPHHIMQVMVQRIGYWKSSHHAPEV